MKKLLLLLSIVCVGQVKAQYTKLYDFTATPDGNAPHGSLVSDGVFFYGMTQQGGANNLGTIFKIMPNGSGYVKLLDFADTNGASPFYNSLISDGTFLIGMTWLGGTNNYGTLFKIKPNGTGYVKLLDFAGAANGSYPVGSLTSDGTFLYGMTSYGGANNLGTIFKIMPNGNGYVKLLDFAGVSNGEGPYGSLFYDGTFLYGMTNAGGTNSLGTIFKIKSDGSGYIKLLDFTGVANGQVPSGSLISDGTFLYGTTGGGGTSTNCGANGCGTIFKIKSDGSGYVNLLNFAGTTNGTSSTSSLFFDGTFLYGTTYQGGINNNGVIFQIKPDGSAYLKLLDFTGTSNGSYPRGSLISDGTFLYGLTASGGANNLGTIFKLSGTVDIAPINIDKEIAIYPNPTNGTFTIKSNTTAKLNADLYDVNGRHVFSKTVVGTADIDANSLDNGIYSLTIKSSLGIAYKKMVIAR
jgi:uncharacterized repeat protein (TIGR03803 family)